MDALLDHIVLNVRDIPISLDFYKNILQFEPERVLDFEAGKVPFPSVRISGDTVIDLFSPNMWESGRDIRGKLHNLNHFCLALEYADWTALRQRLADAHIAVHRDLLRNWGAKGSGISMYFFDPDGNEIEARYYEDEHSLT